MIWTNTLHSYIPSITQPPCPPGGAVPVSGLGEWFGKAAKRILEGLPVVLQTGYDLQTRLLSFSSLSSSLLFMLIVKCNGRLHKTSKGEGKIK